MKSVVCLLVLAVASIGISSTSGELRRNNGLVRLARIGRRASFGSRINNNYADNSGRAAAEQPVAVQLVEVARADDEPSMAVATRTNYQQTLNREQVEAVGTMNDVADADVVEARDSVAQPATRTSYSAPRVQAPNQYSSARTPATEDSDENTDDRSPRLGSTNSYQAPQQRTLANSYSGGLDTLRNAESNNQEQVVYVISTQPAARTSSLYQAPTGRSSQLSSSYAAVSQVDPNVNQVFEVRDAASQQNDNAQATYVITSLPTEDVGRSSANSYQAPSEPINQATGEEGITRASSNGYENPIPSQRSQQRSSYQRANNALRSQESHEQSLSNTYQSPATTQRNQENQTPLYVSQSSTRVSTVQRAAPIGIVRSSHNVAGTPGNERSFGYSFEAENGIKQETQGELRTVGDAEVMVMRGSYEYTGDDGQTYVVDWYADETGFHPSAPHLPQDVPIPFPEQQEAVDAQIRFAAQEVAAATNVDSAYSVPNLVDAVNVVEVRAEPEQSYQPVALATSAPVEVVEVRTTNEALTNNNAYSAPLEVVEVRELPQYTGYGRFIF